MKRIVMVLTIVLLTAFVLGVIAQSQAALMIPRDAKFAVVKSEKTKVYHGVSPGEYAEHLKTMKIEDLKKMKTEDLIFFKTKQEAEKMGYIPCKMCIK